MAAENKKTTRQAAIGEKVITALDLAQNVINLLSAKGLYITTVESCSGGALANAITNVSGSGDVIKDSFITYSNEAKIALGVPEEIIEKFTVYSLEVAVAMARAGLQRSVRADVAVGITGSLTRVDPENKNSVPGEVYLAIVTDAVEVKLPLVIQESDRVEAKLRIVEHALEAITEHLS